MYAVIDLETTGGRASDDKIIEIAILLFDGEKVVDRYQTLVHPECRIPDYITGITGIDDSMVVDAPKFYEVAKKVVEMTEGAIFVAHNVGFDYGFLQAEFAALGYTFERPKLCTVRASRKIIPGHITYSLGKLCQALGIPLYDRHRAMGDAEATTHLLKLLLDTDQEAVEKMAGGNLGRMPQGISPDRLKNMPAKPGLLYFHGKDQELLLIEKTKNLRSASRKALEAIADRQHRIPPDALTDLTWEATGSLLLADLLARQQLTQVLPPFNAKPVQKKLPVSVMAYADQSGYMRLHIARKVAKAATVGSFATEAEARTALRHKVAAFGLCGIMAGLDGMPGPCSHHPSSCRGACMGTESPESYNQRVQEALDELEFPSPKFIIVEEGRTRDEYSAIFVEHGICTGYGFFDREIGWWNDPASLSEFRNPISPDPAYAVIVRQYLRSIPSTRIVAF